MIAICFMLWLLGSKFSDAYESITPSKLNLIPHSRISGGSPAAINQFPWHTYILAYRDGAASTCGGSIISERWVLTAAHCTHGFSTLDLYFGAKDIYSMPTIISSSFWIEHSQYNPSTYNNDIALVQLVTPLTFTKRIQPVGLVSPIDETKDFLNEVAIVLGFGYTSDVNLQESADLLYTHVRIIPNSECTDYYGMSIVTLDTLCAVGYTSPGHSICSGDSGGAMVIKNKNGDYIQIGINSFVSDRGCTTGSPSGYVRLGSFLKWISDHTGIGKIINPANSRLRLNRLSVGDNQM